MSNEEEQSNIHQLRVDCDWMFSTDASSPPTGRGGGEEPVQCSALQLEVAEPEEDPLRLLQNRLHQYL